MRARGRAVLIVGAAGLGLLGLGLGGCTHWWTPGGPMSSEDRYAYISTEWMPQTVSVTDTVSQQVIWTKEVPVGQKLVMKFSEPHASSERKVPDPAYPVLLEWDLWPAKKEWGYPKQETWVVRARRVDVKMRPVPEAPDALGPPLGTPTTEKPPVMGQ